MQDMQNYFNEGQQDDIDEYGRGEPCEPWVGPCILVSTIVFIIVWEKFIKKWLNDWIVKHDFHLSKGHE